MTTDPFRPLALAATALLLGACTVMPTGPNVMVLPGTGRTMDSFRADDLFCRDYAYAQIGGRTRMHLGVGGRVEFEVARVQLDACQPSVEQFRDALVRCTHVVPVFRRERQCSETPWPVHWRRVKSSRACDLGRVRTHWPRRMRSAIAFQIHM